MRAALLCLLPSMALADPAFRAVEMPEQVYSGGWEHFVGGGVAIFDCNGDGLPELYAAGGETPARLFLNRSAGAIRFEAGEAGPTGVTGAYPLDVDGDGWLDLAVLRVGPNLMLKGGPDCTFRDVTRDWGLEGGMRSWTTAFAATWEQGQDWPTLAFGHYVDRDDPDGPFEVCEANALYRPEERHYGAALPLEPGYCALSMLFSDRARTGEVQLRISNDRQYYGRHGQEQMWRLDPLEDLGEPDWPKLMLWGMGIASRDITGDGLPEVMLTSMGDQLLQINEGGAMRSAPYDLGTYAQRPYRGDDGRPSTGWHAEFGDIDNDGRADLFIAKGNVDQMPSNAMRDPNNLLMQQEDGRFVEKAPEAGVDSDARSRGAGLADLNGDGRLDLVVVNRRAPLEVWENVGASGNWVSVELRQDGGNTRAVGAWVEARTAAGVQAQEVTVGGGHASGQAGPLHFGIGMAETADLRVIWPDGRISGWAAVPVGRRTVARASAGVLVFD